MKKIVRYQKEYLKYQDKIVGEYDVWYPEGRFRSHQFTGFAIYNTKRKLVVSGMTCGILHFLKEVNQDEKYIQGLLRVLRLGKKIYSLKDL